MITFVDAQYCYEALTAHRRNLRLDYSLLPSGARVYCKYTVYPHGFIAYLNSVNLLAVPLAISEYPEPLTTYIVRDLWECQGKSITLFAGDPLLVPVLKALKSLGSKVKVVAHELVPFKEFEIEWLTNYAKTTAHTMTGSD